MIDCIHGVNIKAVENFPISAVLESTLTQATQNGRLFTLRVVIAKSHLVISGM